MKPSDHPPIFLATWDDEENPSTNLMAVRECKGIHLACAPELSTVGPGRHVLFDRSVPKVVNDIPMTQRVFSPETENTVNPGQVAYGQ